MSTAVETALHPEYDRHEVLPIYGCKGNPECIAHCWLKGKSGARLRKQLGKLCPDCLTMKPHVHWDRLSKIERMREPRVFSGHMGEIADLEGEDIEQLQFIMERNPRHLFQVFSHQKDFFRNYPTWSKNVWCCKSRTAGEISFPAELQCGMRVGYAEPVMRRLWFDADYVHSFDPDWLVIGLLNHAQYPPFEPIGEYILQLMKDARARGIPIFCKNINDPRWAKIEIQSEIQNYFPLCQEWPK